MEKEKKEILLLLALIPVLAFFVIRMAGEIRGRRGPAPVSEPVPPAGPVIAPATAPVSPAPGEEEVVARGPGDRGRRELAARAREDLPWQRDPFIPPDRPAAEDPAAALRLLGIVHHPEIPLAAIGDGLYREGDTVRGFTVRAIGPDSVTLEDDGREVILRISD